MTASSRPAKQNPVALIADDDPVVRDILRSILTGAGYIVVSAAGGDEALAWADRLSASVAILDVAMPDRNGLEICARLRHLPNWRDVPILILTSYRTEKVLRAARTLGVSQFLCKPFTPADLLRRIALLTGGNAEPEASEPMVWHPVQSGVKDPEISVPRKEPSADTRVIADEGSRFGQQRSLLRAYREIADLEAKVTTRVGHHTQGTSAHHILVAEDDDPTRKVMLRALNEDGHVTQTVSTGPEAVAAVTRDHFDVILMDMHLSAINGRDVTRMIRALSTYKRFVPIIAVVPLKLAMFMRELISARMNDYLMKPIRQAALLDCVQLHLPPRQANQDLLDQTCIETAIKTLGATHVRGQLENFIGCINDILPIAHGWETAEAAVLRPKLQRLCLDAIPLGCLALSQMARKLEVDCIIGDQTCRAFVRTAHVTSATLYRYLRVSGLAHDP